MANPPKLDLEKLRHAMTARPRPSEAEGPRKQEYGSSYKSPYSKRSEVKARPSAPSVLVSAPRTVKRASRPSKYNQAEMNKNRKSRSSKSPPAPTQLMKKPSAVSGYFASSDQEKEKPKKPYISYLMNAPSLSAHLRANKDDDKPSPNLPPPLIPPKPAKTENLPQLPSPSVLVHPRGEQAATASDATKKASARGKVDFVLNDNAYHSKPKRVSLMLDPAKRRSIRDGSVDLELDQIATVQVFEDGGVDDDDEYIEYNAGTLGYFQAAPQHDADDSLLTIRQQCTKKRNTAETTSMWNASRFEFFITFWIYAVASIVVIILACLFVFQYNYGLQHAPESMTNDTLKKHINHRYLLNMHMFIGLVFSLQLYQFSTLLFRLFPNVSRTKMKWIHGAIHIFAAGARVIGSYYAIRYHSTVHTEELYSAHAYVGILSLLIHTTSLITGITFILPCCSWETRVTLIPTHRYSGNFLILSDTATVLTGCIQMTFKFFDNRNFPQLYPESYDKFPAKGIILNMTAIMTVIAGASTMYLQANYVFRRRRKPGSPKSKDLDLEAIQRVTERRQYKALAIEAREHGRNAVEEIQIGSRKSFNLAGKQKYWHMVAASKGKSIPALINEAEKKKSNFTDTDILLALE